jgi:hypothetical protein
MVWWVIEGSHRKAKHAVFIQIEAFRSPCVGYFLAYSSLKVMLYTGINYSQ